MQSDEIATGGGRRGVIGRLWRSRVVRFGALGVANNLLAYAIFAGLTLAGVASIAAATITYVLGMVVSYLGNRSFTFRHTGSARRSLVRFLIVNAVGYGINVAILAIFVEHLGFNALLVQFVAIVIVAGFIFVSMRFWVFSGDKTVPTKPLRWGT
ncbi:GtrA family protein [Agreia sp. COWG]|uniref:GtrA family protein n=1 Tax=Agreia sp. COWG TaxID=2773266 RepID=UPI001926C722|nr:GtrA family protein [Agreia sp. COWG]CAD6002674.1 Putative flippase GtrA (Transmembrane translocase of bactoprenol-linked glucose) [Agreia sp. COWG]